MSARSETSQPQLSLHDYEEVPRDDVEEDCEVCSIVDSVKKDCRDLLKQYEDLSAVYNQARNSLDLQIQHSRSIDEMLKMERKVRLETEARCQVLQQSVDLIEGRQSEANKQQMAIVAKLTDVIYTSQVVGGNVASRVHE